MTPDDYFASYPFSRTLFAAVADAISQLGSATIHLSKSQIAFRRDRRTFARVWIPARYLRGAVAPLVLTLSFPAPDSSPRWKEIVEPASGRFTHHLELFSVDDIDDEVRGWLRAAWDAAA
jgi:hypothetical protein